MVLSTLFWLCHIISCISYLTHITAPNSVIVCVEGFKAQSTQRGHAERSQLPNHTSTVQAESSKRSTSVGLIFSPEAHLMI